MQIIQLPFFITLSKQQEICICVTLIHLKTTFCCCLCWSPLLWPSLRHGTSPSHEVMFFVCLFIYLFDDFFLLISNCGRLNSRKKTVQQEHTVLQWDVARQWKWSHVSSDVIYENHNRVVSRYTGWNQGLVTLGCFSRKNILSVLR